MLPPLIPFVLDYDRVGNIFNYEAQAELEEDDANDDSDDEDDEDAAKKPPAAPAGAATAPSTSGDPNIQVDPDAIQAAQPERPTSPEVPTGENTEELKKVKLREL